MLPTFSNVRMPKMMGGGRLNFAANRKAGNCVLSSISHGSCQPGSRGAAARTRADEPVHIGGAPSPAVRQVNVGSAIPAASAAALEIAN